jgi:hypothetical protein
VPVDIQTIADPRFILLGWAAGLALVTGAVSLAQVVGPGFNWLAGGTAVALGLIGWTLPGLFLPLVGTIVAAGAMILARNRMAAGWLLLAAGATYLIGAASLGGWVLAVTAAVALGGVTGEMVLGHWYLVDPRLPRWTLRGMAGLGIVGLIADGGALQWVGGFSWTGPSIAYAALLGLSVVLMSAVLGALRHPAYSGVMAATGLSYLAVLTSLGAVFLGRAMVAGVGPFTT